MTTSTAYDVAGTQLYSDLAHLMNQHPDRYRVLGDCDMTAIVTIVGPSGPKHIQLVFEALACSAVDEVAAEEAHLADFRLEAPTEVWQAMFDDISANGTATGEWTINSLALRGDQLQLVGDDPMGLDKFSRFNQTLQEYLDGAGRLETTTADTTRSQP